MGLVTDYRYRGVSLSDGKPAAQFSLAYDAAEGWYAGSFASTADLGRPARADVQVLPYVGYARPIDPGLAWDVGVSYSAFLRAHEYDYPQVYFGLATDRGLARLSYAQRYFGEDRRAMYAEVEGSRPLAERFQLIGHLGYLWTDRGGSGQDQTDVRLGVGFDLEQAHVALSWVATDRTGMAYAIGESRDRSAFVLSVTRSF